MEIKVLKLESENILKLVSRRRHSKELTLAAEKFGCIYIRFHFQTFIYSARALSRTKYMSVSNAFCLSCKTLCSRLG